MKPTVAVIHIFKIPKKFKTVAGTVSQSRKLLKSLRFLFIAVWSLKIRGLLSYKEYEYVF